MIPANFGGTELIILLVIILLLFGAKRIPELARGLGTGVREFRKGTSGAYEELEEKKGEEEKDEGGKKEAEASGRGEEEQQARAAGEAGRKQG
ncbi:twin-arginine translocation protein, TatA/E family [Rubrobacter xylanophilus DSM 9941]|uniref:Sec-independent protein translocase protein TatA n=1 Tax=Rubrobacter xylanophilus (strain DSM 9941 / JCM 11954 / NBRC 16129 / PRD-1) TaxID=266117 RepID=TATA_RUBXD|nr:twin-arginine translocase TatA/TatE family subunit [Rubrobacter xylanophilus]Q1AUL2.1 RecName: Full=Sec-independent protein translocase protein TatA [Rubrobacter xylanophilus DSM 9941]ABG04916.1 twin-arginine translocation protein, TatA/E family [Rubrobacter xylanophilus DSM 9941]